MPSLTLGDERGLSHEETALSSIKPPAMECDVKEPVALTIPRSASYTHLPCPVSQGPSFGAIGLRRTLSENVISIPDETARRAPPVSISPAAGFKSKDSREGKNLKARKSSRSRIHPKITISKFTLSLDRKPEEASYERPKTAAMEDRPDRGMKVKSVSGSLSNFARKPWKPASRSPSPSKENPEVEITVTETPVLDSTTPDVRPTIGAEDTRRADFEGTINGISRNSTSVYKKQRRPLSAFLGRSTPGSGSHTPSVPPIPKSLSTDKLPFFHGYPLAERLPALPRTMSSERLQGIGLDLPRRKDELWGAFRTLDGDFQKFQSKPSTLKANVVRSSLLPFLKLHADHASTKNLRPEDLDRRIHILNKWWTGLLEMLNGRNGQSMSGNDRPAILEGVSGIMVRAEWRLSPSAFAARTSASARPPFKSRSTSSLDSTASEFLAESVHHNAKNIFVQNLLAQMAFVVEKMSTRNVAASVVAFCGKASAYAFFFCPGVADILVRLWGTKTEVLRRVLKEINISGSTENTATPENIVAGFPPCLHPLAFSSLPSMVKYLRSQPPLPLGSAVIPWNGTWVTRWTGRDTDLFFVFTKYFYILASQFLPDGIDWRDSAFAPGFLLVQAQILTVLDATIHRPTIHPVPDYSNGPLSVTFDNLLTEPDATLNAIPLPPNNTVRCMAENRLVMLLRDFLSESPPVVKSAQGTFAAVFNAVLKAAARRTSLFEHNACFALCDFMEEAIPILSRYYQTTQSPTTVLDWPFWLDVCKHMMESQNTMTEIRLYAFLYTLWGIIVSDERRKRDLCLDWLLTKDVFEKQFNHWCPMVRAYFMRFLCWRVARFDGEASHQDEIILEKLSSRLKGTWSHFLYTQEQSHKQGLMSASTAPCSPAPGRRLMIIRHDAQPVTGGVFLSFDGIVPPASSTQPTAYARHSSLGSLSQTTTPQIVGDTQQNSSPSRKGWGLLKNMRPFSGSPGDRPKSSLADPTPTASTDVNPARHASLSRGDQSRHGIVAADGDPSAAKGSEAHFHVAPPHRNHSFKFSLEWMDRPYNTGKERRLFPPRLPLPAQMFLQRRHGELQEDIPCKPEGAAIESSKYMGRALAEWAIVVIECQNFYSRRKAEGVPSDRWVETPTLSVETFRKLG